MLTKQEILLGKSVWVESSRVKGTQENCSAMWLTVSSFMVIGFVSGLSLANHFDSESFLVDSKSMPCSAKMDASEKDSGRWSDVWCFLLTFPELF